MSKNSRQIFLIFLAYYGMTCVSNAYFLFGPYYESLGATPQRAGLFPQRVLHGDALLPPARQHSYGAARTYGAR